MQKIKEQNWIENTEQGSELYDIMYFNLPTIDGGGTVSEEHIWKCVNEILKLKNKNYDELVSCLEGVIEWNLKDEWYLKEKIKELSKVIRKLKNKKCAK